MSIETEHGIFTLEEYHDYYGPDRDERANRMFDSGAVIDQQGDDLQVTSQTFPSTQVHTVTIEEPSCTCEDYARGFVCKHLLLAARYLQEQDLEEDEPDSDESVVDDNDLSFEIEPSSPYSSPEPPSPDGEPDIDAFLSAAVIEDLSPFSSLIRAPPSTPIVHSFQTRAHQLYDQVEEQWLVRTLGKPAQEIKIAAMKPTRFR